MTKLDIADSPRVSIVAMISPFSPMAGVCLQISLPRLSFMIKCIKKCIAAFDRTFLQSFVY